MGAQVAEEIESDQENFPILDEVEYAGAYTYLRAIRDRILNSGKIQLKDEFEWQVAIVEDDEVLNAFATPGGYLYFYTGLIKFLDNEDHLAGVMGHEIAHADLRHITEALTRQYGLSLLLDVILGKNQSILVDISQGLTNLAFSREDESESDEFAVIYLAPTVYACDSVAGFFEKLIAEGDGSGVPEFLSTHPNPDDRVEAIDAKVDELGCDTTLSGQDYQSFKDMLP